MNGKGIRVPLRTLPIRGVFSRTISLSSVFFCWGLFKCWISRPLACISQGWNGRYYPSVIITRCYVFKEWVLELVVNSPFRLFSHSRIRNIISANLLIRLQPHLAKDLVHFWFSLYLLEYHLCLHWCRLQDGQFALYWVPSVFITLAS